jgi:hypothetical protein
LPLFEDSNRTLTYFVYPETATMPGRFGMERAREQCGNEYNDGNNYYDNGYNSGYNDYNNGGNNGNYNNYGGPPPSQYNQYDQYNSESYQQYNRPPAGKFDGPGDKPNPFGQGMGYDPARMGRADETPKVITNTRVELPATAYRLDGQKVRILISSL